MLSLDSQINVHRFLQVIVAVAVLHNIAIDNEEIEPPVDTNLNIPHHETVPNELANQQEYQGNDHIRNVIVNQYFNN